MDRTLGKWALDVACGTVLASVAASKLVATGRPPQGLEIAAVLLELALACALFLGVWPKLTAAAFAALGMTFLTFGALGWNGSHGTHRCGCLGDVALTSLSHQLLASLLVLLAGFQFLVLPKALRPSRFHGKPAVAQVTAHSGGPR